MLYLLFQIGSERYAIEARQAVEVVPFVALREIPQSPHGVAGIFNYRGRPVPALDLSLMVSGHPSLERLSTRIIVIKYADPSARMHLLGLVAEHATGMMRCDPQQFVDTGVQPQNAPYLGPVFMEEKGAVQLLRIQHLLPGSARDALLSRQLQFS
jgi:chemotaxis-related protein WspB